MTASTVDGGGMSVPQKGRFEGRSVPELLWELAEARHTGSLVLERDAGRRVIFLRDGRVVFAASSCQEDRLGPFLLRRGQVGLPTLLDAGGQVIRGRRLGAALIEQGDMSQDEVVRAVLDQVREIALSVFPWRSGSWRVSRACLAQDESVTLDLPMEELILAGVRRVRDWRWIRRATGGPRAVYRITKRGSETTLALGLTERAILEQLAHAARVDLLCREVYAPSYDVYRALWALSILGLTERLDPSLVSETFQGPGEGFLGRGGAADLLLRYGSLGLTGVLRLFHDGDEGAVFFREGRIEFATTNDPEQSLVVHLLRRGVISDQDHELALRQLVSGKRVGTLLAELGALGDEEVERFVREQVLDVAQGLVLWEDGEYQVEEGLPSEEAVTLGWSAEDVVMEALEGLENTEKVWNGLGGLDALFRLRPEYLDRLDQMRLRPEIWELVSSLRTEMTLAEILEKRPGPDFEICRMLFALERVRVVERVSQEEILSRARARAEGSDPVASDQSASFLVRERADANEEKSLDGDAAEDNGGQGHSASRLAPELFDEEQRTSPLDLPRSWAALPSATEGDDVFTTGSDPWATQKRSHFELDEILAMGQREIEAEDMARQAEPAPGAESVLIELSSSPEPSDAAPDPEAGEAREPAAEAEDVPAPLEVGSEAYYEDLVVESGAELEVAAAPEEEVSRDFELLAEPEVELETTLELGPEPGDELEPTLELEPEDDKQSSVEAEPESAMEVGLDSGAELETEAAPGPEVSLSAFIAQDAGEVDSERTLKLPRITALPDMVPEPADSELELLPEEEPTVCDFEASPAADELAAEPVAIPVALYGTVDRFNARHAILFSQLRQEIGSGVRNYILTCQKRLGDASKIFEGLSPDRDGAFDRERLSSRLLQNELDPWDAPLESLIEMELGMVRDLLTAARYGEIELSLREIDS